MAGAAAACGACLFRALNIAAGLACVLAAAAFAMSLALRLDAPARDAYYFSGQAVRAFGLLWALLLLLVETEWRLVLRWVPALDAWAGRGLAQAFLGALVYREA